MKRITHSTRRADVNGTGKDGFSEGDATAAIPRTVVTAAFMNSVQEEVSNASPAPQTVRSHVQLRDALYLHRIHDAWLNTTFDDAEPASAEATEFAYGGGYYVGYDGATPRTWDPETATWTTRTAPSGALTVAPHSDSNGVLVYCEDAALFACGGTGGKFATTPDGITWTSRTAAASFTGDWAGLSYSPIRDRLVAIGDDGELQYSDDGGITWTQAIAGSLTASCAGVVWMPEQQQFCALVLTTTDVQRSTSADGITWTAYATESFGSATSSLSIHMAANDSVIAYNVTDPLVGATGQNARISTDGGSTWTEHYDTGTAGYGECYGGLGLICIETLTATLETLDGSVVTKIGAQALTNRLHPTLRSMQVTPAGLFCVERDGNTLRLAGAI